MASEIWLFLGSVITAVVGAVIWFGKQFVSRHIEHAVKLEYDQRLEEHKSDLQKSAEQFKSELAILGHERQLRFSHLHEKAAEIASETYHNLWAVMTALSDYVRVYEHPAMGTKEDRRKVLSEKITQFHNHFYPRWLFISRPLADKVVAFHKKIIELTTEFMYKVEKCEEQDDPDDSRVRTWVKVNEQLQNEAQPLYDSLEDEFRKLLGVEVADLPHDKVELLPHDKVGLK
jgi:hypothetical protein